MARNLSFLYQLLSVFLKRKAKRKTKKKKKLLECHGYGGVAFSLFLLIL